MDVHSMEFFTLRNRYFRDVIGSRISSRGSGVLSEEETLQAMRDHNHDEEPLERNVDINIFERQETPSASPSGLVAPSGSSMPSDIPSDIPSVLMAPSVPSGSSFPSSAPSDIPSNHMMPSSVPFGSSLPSDIPSDIPSDLPSPSMPIASPFPSDIPSDIPSDLTSPSSSSPDATTTNIPTVAVGVPVTLPPIPFLETATSPPFVADMQPVTLPPVEIRAAKTRPPNEVTRPPPTPPIIATMPTSSLPPVIIAPSGAVSSKIPTPAPSANNNQTVTIEQFLTRTLTDDGSLQNEGTPQYMALTQLLLTNPQLDPNMAADQVEIRERYALNTLYYAMSGDSWAVNTKWTTADPPCSPDGLMTSNWVGVACEETTTTAMGGRRHELRGLYLRENEMRGQLPSEIRGLSTLRILNLGSNVISGRIPTTLGELVNLEELVLDVNYLGSQLAENGTSVVQLLPDAIPSQIGRLTRLQGLDLKDNYLGPELNFEYFAKMSNLTALLLRLNAFSGDILPSVGDLSSSLTLLDLSDNNFMGTLPTEIGNLVALTDLRIARTDPSEFPDGLCPSGCLNGTVPTEFGKLVNLKILWLSENALTGTLPSELGSVAGLSECLLNTNSLTGEIPTEFSSLDELVSVDLSVNYFGPLLPLPLFNKANMTFLYLGINEFADDFPRVINLPKIQTLSLRQNNITGTLSNRWRT